MLRTAAASEAPLRVLVIEDDLIFLKIIPTYLRHSSGGRISAVLASDLESGLEMLGQRPAVDAVLLDLTLPDSEGLETLLRVQDFEPEVPVIVLTGLDDEDVAAEAVRRGAQDFLVKSDLNASILTRSIRYAIERNRAEAALRESEGRFRAVVEDQTELICRFRPGGRLTFANQALCRFFGSTQERVLELGFFRLTGLDPMEFAGFEDPARPTRSREQHLTIDGSSAWIQWTDRALFDNEGKLGELQSVGRDITEQKKLERQLYQSQKTETLGRLAGGVAHDFNNLLTVIVGCSGMIAMERRRSGLAPHPQLVEIGKAAERAAALTRQLLAVSRRHVSQPTVLDLNQVVRHTEEMLRRLIGARVRLVVRLDPALPPIKADRAQVEQILVNLVVNARDAMPEGGEVVIETRTAPVEAGSRQAELVVADTGVGMEPETRDKIFEPFFTTKEVGRGTGLGLAIVDSLVKESRGSISLETAPGRGSSFLIRLPVTEERPVEEEKVSATPRIDGPRRSASILLVEDEWLVRDVVQSLLEPHGYRVRGVACAEEALGCLEDGGGADFDLLLTDIVLPDVDGIQLARVAQDRFPRLRVLFMSGYPAGRDRDDWPGAGASFLQKPFSAEELLAKLDELLRPRP